MSASRARRPGSSGVIAPSQMRPSAGSRRAAEAALDDVASVMRTAGWRASSRSSSWPVKPVAPATATRATAPAAGSGGVGEAAWRGNTMHEKE